MLNLAIIIFLLYCAKVPEVWYYGFIACAVLDAARILFFNHKPKVTVNIPQAVHGMDVPKSEGVQPGVLEP